MIEGGREGGRKGLRKGGREDKGQTGRILKMKTNAMRVYTISIAHYS